MEPAPDDNPAMRLFYPYAHAKQDAVRTEGMRFVHYTNADAAMTILSSKEIWMRKTSCMNDYMEVEHGLECLSAAYHSEKGKKFKNVLDVIFNGISEEVGTLFDGWAPHFRGDSYVMCVSEHDNSEDRLGRLSIWRAYSETTGAALVLNNTVFLGPSGSLKVYTSPVAYLDDEQFGDELGRIADAIEADQEVVRAFGRQAVISYVFTAFKFAALCTKHPGFREEREWRVVYFPKMESSERLTKQIQVIRGTPQPIYKVPLQNIPEEDIAWLELPELVDRIIIGPTDYASAMREAFSDLLASAGVKDSGDRVHVSTIPLR